MQTVNLNEVLAREPDFQDADSRVAKFWRMQEFDGGTTWVGKWSGESPWEKHKAGDEFLHVLEGEVEVLVLTNEGTKRARVSAGEVFVVPKGHWHKQVAANEVTVLGATPGVTEHSEDEPQA